MNRNEFRLEEAKRAFYIHSNGQKVKFVIACPDNMDNQRKNAKQKQAFIEFDRKKMNQIVIKADIE